MDKKRGTPAGRGNGQDVLRLSLSVLAVVLLALVVLAAILWSTRRKPPKPEPGVFRSGGETYSEQEVMSGALSVMKNRVTPRVAEDARAFLPSREWLRETAVVEKWGPWDERTQTELGTGEHPITKVGYEYYGRGYSPASKLDPREYAEANAAFVDSADGRVFFVGGQQHYSDTGVENTLDPLVFKYGLIPLFGTYSELKQVLGEPCFEFPIVGTVTIAEWLYIMGSTPDRIALDVYAKIQPDKTQSSSSVTIRVAYETGETAPRTPRGQEP